ncbi:hypothetical protein QQS21_008584 [Conoideocrella luteorostrata]|uniref:Rhodopsin domain-containing protein n=1 Tax=Conoideocrella luteorostrata TaxID=1105319 RepID=A0AAJ0CLB0_9HYPO|nr:hypothetical protein QQS21_008584 [Conoideocrella luteorostrata]
MPSENELAKPPDLDNPRGRGLEIAVSIVLGFMTIIVALRLWGRYQRNTPGGRRSAKPQYGESMFWILMSDIAVVVSYVLSVTLTILCCMAIRWGEGLHIKALNHAQARAVLKIFYVYQVVYKFVSGIAKIATLFLLLAISMVQMRVFNLFCKSFAAYIALYCIGTSVATIFQCGLYFRANWSPDGKEHCIELPAFWFSHAAINVSATTVMAILPWWLFTNITYKRKHTIAIIMTLFALAETALGSAKSDADMVRRSPPDGTVTGILTSQLEVDFACIAACVPTVLKMMEELWIKFCIHVLGRTSTSWKKTRRATGNSSTERETATSERSRRSDKISTSIPRTVHSGPYDSRAYANIGRSQMDDKSTNSREHIFASPDNRTQVGSKQTARSM